MKLARLLLFLKKEKSNYKSHAKIINKQNKLLNHRVIREK